LLSSDDADAKVSVDKWRIVSGDDFPIDFVLQLGVIAVIILCVLVVVVVLVVGARANAVVVVNCIARTVANKKINGHCTMVEAGVRATITAVDGNLQYRCIDVG